ncbi:MAG: DUF2807 domain-containing protein [Dysgonamonadaceae bacterium]|jgi:phage shock protein PspC (stress-responsive transcriptional regulator)|nr:DUF2807 domain-containing protein [Dysgonamonadaceae bacterium]
MKKTITVNLNGRVFTMDEDAYHLLDNYLKNLRIYFRKEEGSAEIIADFEARIEELLSEKIHSGYEVITITQVEEVITRVGKPADFADKEEEKEAEKQSSRLEYGYIRKKFFRDMSDNMFGGVCSGIAAYFGWDVLAVRIITVILLFATALWIVPVYLLAWLFFPAACTAEEKLMMRGKPITVENIGKAVAAEMEAPKVAMEKKGCLSDVVDLIVALMKAFLVVICCLIGIPLLFALVITLITLFAVLFGVGGGLLSALPFGWIEDSSFLTVAHPLLATISLIFVLAIPLISLIYAVISYLAKLKPVNKAVKWIFFVIWLLAFVLFLFSGLRINLYNLDVRWKPGQTVIQGNGEISEKNYSLTAIDGLEFYGNLSADFQVEQIDTAASSLRIIGDENLIEKIKYEVREGNLYLSTPNSYNLRPRDSLKILLRTPELKAIHLRRGGKLRIHNAFKADNLEIELEGAGKVTADSLDVKTLKVSTEGVGSVRLAGKVRKANLYMEGTGEIDALELVADSVIADIEGIGAIKCNAVEYLKGTLNGIGKITYKDEPKVKDMTSSGIGKIGRN